jgi:MoxR-like ATPase
MNWQLTAKLGKRKGASWPISEMPLILGRAEGCGVRVHDPHVSREHCSVQLVEDEVVLEDMGSSNASLVNGEPVSRCVLSLGDEVSVGSALFILTRTHALSDTSSYRLVSDSTVLLDVDDIGVKPGAGGLAAKPRNIHDLVALNELATYLARCASRSEVAEAVVQCVAREIPDATCLLIGCEQDDGTFPSWPAGVAIPASYLDAARACWRAMTPRIERVVGDETDKTDRHVCMLPVESHALLVGALSLTWRGDNDFDVESNVGFAMAVARAAAPHLAALESEDISAVPIEVGTGLEAAAFLGGSDAARQVNRMVAVAAGSELPVIVQGETGTGKDLVAQLVRVQSARAEAPFVAVNCAAIPDGLFESEFFGHVRGAFTGATDTRVGLVEQAQGGILFLDEVMDLNVGNQARLLRAIETGYVRPVGGQEKCVDFRVVVAANRDPLEAVRAGAFREDLYYRLSGVEIQIPPLRERTEDIAELVSFFAAEFGLDGKAAPQFSDEAIAYLGTLSWPGNVRELRNCVGRVIAAVSSGSVSAAQAEEFACPSFERGRSAR